MNLRFAAMPPPLDRKLLLIELVRAARRQLFGAVTSFALPEASPHFRPIVGADSKENWLFHKILDRIEKNTESIGKPHFAATYEAAGLWSAGEWAIERTTGTLPDCVSTHRGPLRSPEVLQDVRRSWERSLIGRSRIEGRLKTPLGEFDSRVDFVVGTDSGRLWVSVLVETFVEGHSETLSEANGRMDRRIQLQAPADQEYIDLAESFANESIRRGHRDVAESVAKGIWKNYKTRILSALLAALLAGVGIVASYAASASVRKVVREEFPAAARVLDRLTGQRPEPERPRSQQTKPPRRNDIGRIIELGAVVPVEPTPYVNAMGQDQFIQPIYYDKEVAAVAPLVIADRKIQPQIIATRSRRDPKKVFFRVFLGDLWVGAASEYIFTFGDKDENFILFEAEAVEEFSYPYRGFTTTFTYSDFGSYEVKLLGGLKNKMLTQGIAHRFHLPRTIEKGPSAPAQDPLTIVQPYTPAAETIWPKEDDRPFRLLYDESEPGSERLARSSDGTIRPQILAKHLGEGRVLFHVFLPGEYRRSVSVSFDENLRFLGVAPIPGPFPGFSILHTFATPGRHSFQAKPVSIWSVPDLPPLRYEVVIPERTVRSTSAKGPDP